MAAQETPSGTRMMWKASVKAICARAHGTGSTSSGARNAPANTCVTAMTTSRPSVQALEEVVAHPQRVRDRRERRVHGSDAGEEARVHHVQVVHVVRLAVHVERAGGGIGAE